METDIYVIQSGDTLTGIADKFNISAYEISSLNKIPFSQALVTGQAIIIPHKRKTIKSLGFFHLDDLQGLERSLVNIGRFFTFGALFQLSVTAGGALLIPMDNNIGKAIELLKSFNIIPLLVITNLTPAKFDPDLARTVINNESVKAILIRNLLFLLDYYGFSGINIDFENVYPEDRQRFTNFIRDVKQVLAPKGYWVSLTVPPKNSDDPESITKGAYDYQALGQWADFLFIMTYDWGVIGGPPMAVSPIHEVKKVLSYAISQISSSKIMQGIPLYGYEWQLPYSANSVTRAINLVEVYDLARRYHAAIEYDPVAQSPHFQYTDEKNTEYVVWFEDVRSITVKYAATFEFNLGGVGFWSGKNDPYGFPQNWVVFDERFQPAKTASWIK
jgi:spore germination protein